MYVYACAFFNHAGDRQCIFLKIFSRLPLLSACAFTIIPNYGSVTETACFQNYAYIIVDIQDQNGLLNTRFSRQE